MAMLEAFGFLIILASVLADHICLNNTTCITACTQADGSECAQSRCDLAYQHCACAGPAALRRDGGCEAAVLEVEESARQCASPTYDVLLTAASKAAPDLKPDDFRTGELVRSTPLATVLLSSLGAGLERPIRDILISRANLKLHSKTRVDFLGKNTRSPTLLFDMDFSFCIAGNSSVEDDFLMGHRVHSFERRFSEEAQRYAAMYPSTLRVLSVVRHVTHTSEALVENPASGAAVPGQQIQDKTGIACIEPAILWAGIAMLSIASSACFIKTCMLMHQRHRDRADVNPATCTTPDCIEPDQPPFGWLHGAIALACVTQAFDPTEAAQWEGCLALHLGDVVEVHAASGLWLYGRAHGRDAPMGLFLESQIAWIGQSLPNLLADSAVQAGVPSGQEAHVACLGQAVTWSLPGQMHEGIDASVAEAVIDESPDTRIELDAWDPFTPEVTFLH